MAIISNNIIGKSCDHYDIQGADPRKVSKAGRSPCVYCNVFSLMLSQKPLSLVSAIQLLKWLLISLNTWKPRSASADVTSRVYPNTSKILCSERNLDLQILRISSKYQLNRVCQTVWTRYWTIWIPHYPMTSELAGLMSWFKLLWGRDP